MDSNVSVFMTSGSFDYEPKIIVDSTFHIVVAERDNCTNEAIVKIKELYIKMTKGWED